MAWNLRILMAIFTIVVFVTAVQAMINYQDCQNAMVSAAQSVTVDTFPTPDPMKNPACVRMTTFGRVIEAISH